jgi:hypothetical protein
MTSKRKSRHKESQTWVSIALLSFIQQQDAELRLTSEPISYNLFHGIEVCCCIWMGVAGILVTLVSQLTIEAFGGSGTDHGLIEI